MRALVTNDDGVHSAGLRVLANAARACGMDVTVVAPSFDASGSSASMTAVARDGKVVVEEMGDTGRDPVLGVHGPPAFIVRAAMYGAFGPAPDVVLAGVNRGLNTGRAILHSGTVGAALTACTYGRSGLAVSAGVVEPDAGEPAPLGDEGWLPGRPFVEQAVGWLEKVPPATVLNVNIPAAGADDPAGVRSTRLAETGMVQGRVSDSAGGYVPVVFSDHEGPPRGGTDTCALAEGYISVTAVRAVIEDARVDLAGVVGGEAASG
jgi:5'-nucleotidase